jgi:FixJ family two-component response regulator
MVRVLVLEDDTDLRELLGEVLLSVGADSCVFAGTVADLHRREIEVLGCDLAILDINLGPGQPSGIDACRWLVNRRFGGRIVFLTGHASSHPLVLEAARIAQASILAKPLSASRLAELVQECR